jgi:hypothetical protein
VRRCGSAAAVYGNAELRAKRPPPLLVPPETAFCAMEAPAEGVGSESVEGWFEKARAGARLSA